MRIRPALPADGPIGSLRSTATESPCVSKGRPAHVRAAAPADAAVVADIHHHGWMSSYRGLLPDAYLDSLDADACLNRWTSALTDGTPLAILVAELDARVVGFVAAGPSTDPDATSAGEIWDLWVTADARSHGVGAELLRVALDHLASGHRAALVWVLAENTRGRTFYARAGAVQDGMTRSTPVTGGTMTDVRYLWDLRERLTSDSVGASRPSRQTRPRG